MPEREAVTLHGDVAYKTVECSSCGSEVAKQTAQRMIVGDVVEYQNYRAIGKEKYSFDPDTIRKGWACEYCRHEGPTDFPRRRLRDLFTTSWFEKGFLLMIGIWIGALLMGVGP